MSILLSFLFIISIFLGVINDYITQKLLYTLSGLEIIFVRNFFSLFYLLFFIKRFYFNWVAIIRGVITFTSFYFLSIGLKNALITNVTACYYMIPLTTILLCWLFKIEKPILKLFHIPILLLIIWTFNQQTIMVNAYILIACAGFSVCDLLIKIESKKYSDYFVNMLYNNVTVSILSGVLTKLSFFSTCAHLNYENFVWCFYLSMGGVFIQHLLFMSFNKINLSILLPLRYFDIPFASLIEGNFWQVQNLFVLIILILRFVF